MPDFQFTTEDYWLCLQSGSRAEIELTNRLLALDVPAYCPRYERPLGDRGAWLAFALFPSYLFCERTAYESRLHHLKNLPTHLRQLIVGDLPARTLAEIQLREDRYGFIPVDGIPRRNHRAPYNKGDLVEVSTGVMTGMKGCLSREPSQRIAWLHIHMLGGEREIAVEIKNLRPVLCTA